MSNLEKIYWEKKYSVDIEEIDSHQKKMFELFNQLIDMEKTQEEIKECVNMISVINEYSKLYFSTEEKYLRKNGYPDLVSHTKLHRQFTKHSISLRREISDDIANLTDDVIEGLRNWMMTHILESDSLYIPFLRINKYIKESKRKN
jgi:hemerythrin